MAGNRSAAVRKAWVTRKANRKAAGLSGGGIQMSRRLGGGASVRRTIGGWASGHTTFRKYGRTWVAHNKYEGRLGSAASLRLAVKAFGRK